MKDPAIIIVLIIALTVGDVVGEVFGPRDDCQRLVQALHKALATREVLP